MTNPIERSVRGRNIFRNVCRGSADWTLRPWSDKYACALWRDMGYYERMKTLAIIAYHGG